MDIGDHTGDTASDRIPMNDLTDNADSSYTLDVIPGTDIVLFHWVGPISAEDRTKNLGMMADYCNDNNLSKLLIDGRDQLNQTDFMASYSFGAQVPDAFQGLLVAVVHRPDDDTLKFIETVAFNRGSGTRAFTDIDEASAWLESL